MPISSGEDTINRKDILFLLSKLIYASFYWDTFCGKKLSHSHPCTVKNYKPSFSIFIRINYNCSQFRACCAFNVFFSNFQRYSPKHYFAMKQINSKSKNELASSPEVATQSLNGGSVSCLKFIVPLRTLGNYS